MPRFVAQYTAVQLLVATSKLSVAAILPMAPAIVLYSSIPLALNHYKPISRPRPHRPA